MSLNMLTQIRILIFLVHTWVNPVFVLSSRQKTRTFKQGGVWYMGNVLYEVHEAIERNFASIYETKYKAAAESDKESATKNFQGNLYQYRKRQAANHFKVH